MGGRAPIVDVIEYITIASTGNVTDFGDLLDDRSAGAGVGSGTRGIHAGGYSDPAAINVIEYVTIASTGDSQDFGDLTRSPYILSGTSNSIRAVFGGGLSPATNVMDYITIASTGNAADFGDLITASAGRSKGATSDSHGGLQG